MMSIIVMKAYAAKRKHEEVYCELHRVELTGSGGEIPR